MKRFGEGSGETCDAACSGRPSTARDLSHIQQAEELRRWTCEELSEQLDISTMTVHRILTRDLRMRKVGSTSSVTRTAARISGISTRLLRHHMNESHLLNKIVAIDETWIQSYDPELKWQTSEWRHLGSPCPIKFRQKPSSENVDSCLQHCWYGSLLLCTRRRLSTLGITAPALNTAEKKTTAAITYYPPWQRYSTRGSHRSRAAREISMGVSSSPSIQPGLESVGWRSPWEDSVLEARRRSKHLSVGSFKTLERNKPLEGIGELARVLGQGGST